MMKYITTLGKRMKVNGYLKNDILLTSFSYDRYIMGMEELKGFGIKKCLSLPSLANTCFNSLRDENDEPIS